MGNDPIIAVENLSFRYPGANHDTLRNVNLTINRGDFVAIVGSNGAAKTTLCKTFNGLIPHYWSGDFAGSVHVSGVDTFTSSVSDLSRTVGYVYQDFQNQLVRPTVHDEVSFGPINYGLEDHESRTERALNTAGIGHLSNKFVWQLSGGQSHLTALAGVLALQPDVIVVDEPVAELDPARAEEIYEKLRELNQVHGITVITIEHHAEFIAKYASSVVLMAHGAPVWHLPVEEALLRTHELEEHGIPAPQCVAAVQELGVSAAPRTPTEAAALIRREFPALGEASGLGRARGTSTLAGLPSMGRVVADVREVSHGYKSVTGKVEPVLNNLDVTLREGERIALVGGNGAGKSTLLKLLAGITVPRQGNVEVENRNTRKVSARRMAETVAYLPQHPHQVFLKHSVRADVALSPTTRKLEGAHELVERLIERVNLSDFAETDGRMLSGGQQRRASLAIGLAMLPSVLLLDEPTSSLDVRSREDVTALLAELSDTINCSVVATHDMQLVAEWATRVLVLSQGKVIADLTPRELFCNAELCREVGLRPPQITQVGLELGMTPVPLSVSEFVSAAHLTNQLERI